MNNYCYLKRFDELSIEDVSLVGGKNDSLGEMYQKLTGQGVKVPNGYATTTKDNLNFISSNELDEKTIAALKSIDLTDVDSVSEAGAKIRRWVSEAPMPETIRDEIVMAYRELCHHDVYELDVAFRSSATAEDSQEASFAGQQETYLNISGEDQLIRACKLVFDLLFTNCAIFYREDKGFAHSDVALSIGVQKMSRYYKGTSGVIFTLDKESGFRIVVLITGTFGLGENVVQGAVDPDEFYVFKPTLASYRYPPKMFHECFAMECIAIKNVREVMGLNNLNIMIPFVLTVHELEEVLSLLEKQGFKRGEHGLKIMIMCEVPAKVVLA